MKVLVFSNKPRTAGKEILDVVRKNCSPGRFCGVQVTRHPHENGVYVFPEDDNHSEAEKIVSAIGERALLVIGCSWETFLEERRREGVIPEGYPRAAH